MEINDKRALFRFVMPVALENFSSVLIAMVLSAIIGTISYSALAATSTANLVITLYSSLFSLLTVGSAVITARLVGANDRAEASRTVEQTIFLTIVLSLALMVLSLALASPLMRLLMPNAEDQLYHESVRYFRVTSLCVPGMMIYCVLVSVLRASGDARMPLIITTIVNLVQIGSAYLFIVVLRWGVLGAALPTVLCRTVGGALSLAVVLKVRQGFHVQFRKVFRPHRPTLLRIVRVGLPTTLESCFVQIGYIIANSLAVGLGTQAATIYQIANNLQSFANVPMTVGGAIATTFIGQSLGAGHHQEARRNGYRILLYILPVVGVLYVLMATLSPWLAPLYSSDAAVVSGTVAAMWVLMGFALPALSINVIDPCLRVGGDVRFVMLETLVGVWLARLPLSWLLAYQLNMGINGIYLANILSLVVRAMIGQARYASGKWLYKKV